MLNRLRDTLSYLLFLCTMQLVIGIFFLVVLAIPMTIVYGIEYAKSLLNIVCGLFT